ncbi:MAG: hypothetical protein LPK85_00350, partial [Gammaproteobacteria bacterium]|nr:hypothetical protein [Gammaproteobacteria bacterium]
RQGCLEMQHDEWELAALARDGYKLYFGNEDDVKAYLEGSLPENPKPAARDAAPQTAGGR